MTKTIFVKTIVNIPMLPNFFSRDNDKPIPIEAIIDEDIRKIGNEWTEELIKKAQSKRTANPRRKQNETVK